MSALDWVVIGVYFAAMILAGFWGMRRAKDTEGFIVAGRRLGVPLFTGALCATALGGASTVGSVGLGYAVGISGAWMVLWLGVATFAIVALAHVWARLKVFSVAEVLHHRYGLHARLLGALSMGAYEFMLIVTQIIAVGTILTMLLDLDLKLGILIGAGVVLVYSTLGGMWAITLTDIIQFVVMTIGMFIVFLPLVISRVGGWGEMWARLPKAYGDIWAVGRPFIWMYFLIWVLGVPIMQDVWQRVLTARSTRVARVGGAIGSIYAIAYAFCTALIGCGLAVLIPGIDNPYEAFARGAELMPIGLGGLIIAAALAAIMSTASGGLIGAATLVSNDIVNPLVVKSQNERTLLRLNRVVMVALGIAATVVALLLQDIVAAITVGGDIVVAGLVAPVLGAMLWKRGTAAGAIAGMVCGSVMCVVMLAVKGLWASEPVSYGALANVVAFVGVSLLTAAPSDQRMREYERVVGLGAGAAAPAAGGEVGEASTIEA